MKKKSLMRRARSSLILAFCLSLILAVTGCRTTGKKTGGHAGSSSPAKSDSSPAVPDPDLKKSEQPAPPAEEKPATPPSLPIAETPSNTVALPPPAAPTNKPAATGGNTNLDNSVKLPQPPPGKPQTAADASAVRLQIPDRGQNASGAKTNLFYRPTLGGTSRATGATNDNIPARPLPIGLWQSLTSSSKHAGSTAPLMTPGAGQTPSNHSANGVTLPVKGDAHPASSDNETPAAVLPVEPLLENGETEAQRREREAARQESERKAREAGRDNLNRAFYRFLLGQ